MRTLLQASLLCLPVVCLPLRAQQSFTSPRNMESVEGSGSHGYVLGAASGARWQQVDGTLRGAGFQNVQSIAFRRDGLLATNAAFGARVLQQVSVLMSHATLPAVRKDQSTNYKDTPVLVFTPRDVNAPDWSVRPAAGTAPFDLRLPFDTPWSYNGTDDLLWEVRIQDVAVAPTTVSSYPFDFVPGPGALQQTTYGVALGQGCLATGQTQNRFTLHASLANEMSRFRLRHSTNFAPGSAAVVTFVDFSDPNLTVPGLCAVLHALPTVLLDLGIGSTTGAVPSRYVEIPYEPAAIGFSLYLQAVAADAGQGALPIAVSQGSRVTVPAPPSLPGVAHAVSHARPGGVLRYEAVAPGGIVARFEHP
jgi:hypothetical protein